MDPDQASRLLLTVLGIEAPDHDLDVWSLTDLVAFSPGIEGGCSIVDAISVYDWLTYGVRVDVYQ